MAYINTTEAARRLGLSLDQVRRLIRSGKLKARKEGQVWMIDERELESLRLASVSQASQEEIARIAQLEAENRALKTENEALKRQIEMLRERIREMQEERVFLRERILNLERWLEEERARALPKPRTSLGESIRKLFKHKREEKG